ncbi:N-acetylmuramoyl-L-alanine amidase [Bacillus sp. AFS059628]|uniref:N-acetylmuramoyl-L-alanine amidase C-terminal domain-containing protein n=1 Tax=Bacillus sp. AFS059628 TaxID=2033508 RepID=UPI000BF7F7B0|nr:N-acetylmuramoyl-L-alanine amidase C-terminal domain-containing protein [Bacillus sp. AFS059628]PFV81775.1 N-acetylmuramoyl-L-alanine amidase [Bacillus sp. AFS059628]
MGKLAGSGGHNSIVQGANSIYGKEHVEDRRFLDAVAKYVQVAGWKYVNCSDEVGTTQTAVWSNAANNHLRVKDSTVDTQFHLNATPGGTGCEVWLHPEYGDRKLAAAISKAMANAFGLKDRGIKFSTELGWINKTKTGLLPEICFIDNETDMQKYRANFDKAAKAVAEVIVGKTIQSSVNNEGVAISMNKFNKVVTYEFGTALVPEMLGMMDALGYESRIISGGDKQGLVRYETNYRQGNELDRATAWLDAKGLKYFYTKE